MTSPGRGLGVLRCISGHLVGAVGSARTEARAPGGATGPLVAVGGGGMDAGGEILAAIKSLVAERNQ